MVRARGRFPLVTRRSPVVARTLLVLASALLAPRADAAELRLPPSARTLPATIAAACPECATTGYTPCGSADVQWGARFAPHAFLGTPARAYLVTSTMTGEEFRRLARATDYDELVATLQTRFATSRLVVIDRAFDGARVLPRPTVVAVTFPAPLHACVRASDRPWACCSDCKDECCEKALGSPLVVLTWHDGDETLTFHYSHTIGVSWLERNGRARRTRYACLTDAVGTLRSTADRH